MAAPIKEISFLLINAEWVMGCFLHSLQFHSSCLHHSINFIFLIHQTNSLLSSIQNKRAKTTKRKEMKALEAELGCARGAAAHNPQMERKENFSSINQHKPTHSLVCGLMKRKLKKEEERRDCGLPLL